MMKAFAVFERNDNLGGIYFAKHKIAATIRGATELVDGEITDVSCHRASWADQYAESGIVPAAVLVERGWTFWCNYCGDRIDNDLALEDPSWSPAQVVGHQNSQVFCDPQCEESHNAVKNKD